MGDAGGWSRNEAQSAKRDNAELRQGREEKAFMSIKWFYHLIEGAVQQPLSIAGLLPAGHYDQFLCAIQ